MPLTASSTGPAQSGCSRRRRSAAVEALGSASSGAGRAAAPSAPHISTGISTIQFRRMLRTQVAMSVQTSVENAPSCGDM